MDFLRGHVNERDGRRVRLGVGLGAERQGGNLLELARVALPPQQVYFRQDEVVRLPRGFHPHFCFEGAIEIDGMRQRHMRCKRAKLLLLRTVRKDVLQTLLQFYQESVLRFGVEPQHAAVASAKRAKAGQCDRERFDLSTSDLQPFKHVTVNPSIVQVGRKKGVEQIDVWWPSIQAWVAQLGAHVR